MFRCISCLRWVSHASADSTLDERNNGAGYARLSYCSLRSFCGLSPLRNVLVGAAAFIAAVTGCGVSPQVRSETKETQPTMQVLTPNAWAAGDTASALSRYVFAVFLAAVREQRQPVAPAPQRAPDPVRTVGTPTPTVPAASSPWSCIAEAETGTDWAMHGSTYSTAFGVINDIVYQYGSPEEQREIFSGTASPQTQIDVVSRFAAVHGFGGWGELTKQKCGL